MVIHPGPVGALFPGFDGFSFGANNFVEHLAERICDFNLAKRGSPDQFIGSARMIAAREHQRCGFRDIIEMDPKTFELKILKYVVVHDCGTVINPMILAGQIHGGVAQGIGNAFYEKLVFDDQGQLLNASLADYLLPTALDVPRMELAHTVTKSPLNPMGIKGAGEAGAIPGGPLFAQAIEDALDLKRRSVELLETPLSPSRLFELTRNART